MNCAEKLLEPTILSQTSPQFPWDIIVSVIEYVLSQGMSFYLVYLWGSEWFPRYYALNDVNWWDIIHRHAHGLFPVSAIEWGLS